MADPTTSPDATASRPALDRRRLAVLGSPIAHSLSPALHTAAYRALGLPWQYTATRVDAGELAGFIDGLTPEWLGLSLTMPLKHSVQSRLNDLDRVATLTGAVNTVRIENWPADGSTPARTGYNTDVPGLVRALAEAGIDRAVRVTLLGAGATAASALVAAAELGAETVDIIARTPTRADTLVDLGRRLGLVVTVSGLSAVADAARVSDLVISTLPGDARLAAEFPAALRANTLLFDVGYAPWPTALAGSWAAAGGRANSGLTMLLHQALIQVRIFVGNDPFLPLPDEDQVLLAMRAALPADGRTGADSAGHPVEG
ncbi:shikimate dehydrogenase [Cryobacterium sp.]|jgi:shikimate dehydrogenase|uniref:shikimate dehydrogenase n=1 Tax=Cryobacterium sp. TaxID=1926290 RepID=UPI002638F714|nr:shikimate dehydrogenase [Cryobacterium sp.]MCU1446571.1 shikimate dehydrogenase [Cryobacterium sp.]